MAGDAESPSRDKPAHHYAGGLIRLGNDIGLSMSDNPLSRIFSEIVSFAADDSLSVS